MKSRIIEEDGNTITVDEGDGYKCRATYARIGRFDVIAVDWEHPNYGYFADAMLWYKSLHMTDWDVVPIVAWSQGYGKLEFTKRRGAFLKDYPEFKRLFEVEQSILDELPCAQRLQREAG